MAEFSFDLSALITAFGAQYTNDGQSDKDIKTQLFAQDDILSLFKKQPETSDSYTSIYATVGEVSQAFSIPFTPKGSSVFKPWSTNLGEFKIDALFTPDKFRNSYLGFWAELSEVDRSKWPVLRWFLQKLVIPRAKQDFLLSTAYWGWKATGFAAVPATPTVNGTTFVRELRSASNPNGQPANATMDGVRIQLIKMAAAGRSLQITTGALSDTPVDFCTQVETMAMAVPVELRQQIDYFNMSIDRRNLYREGRRQKYNLNYAQVSDLDEIKDTPIKVNGTIAMTGSKQIWGTPPANRIMPMHADNTGRFDVQKSDRSVKMLEDSKWLITFDIPEFVVHTDQDLTIDGPMITSRYTEPAIV